MAKSNSPAPTSATAPTYSVYLSAVGENLPSTSVFTPSVLQVQSGLDPVLAVTTNALNAASVTQNRLNELFPGAVEYASQSVTYYQRYNSETGEWEWVCEDVLVLLVHIESSVQVRIITSQQLGDD